MTAKILNQRVRLLLAFSFSFFIMFLSPVFAADSSQQPISDSYSPEELTQMLAPIALYPDALLSQILIASTYPIEVIEADRWVRQNSSLQGDDLDDALYEQEWDPSVKALCHFPSTLASMSERISETTTLGNAFLAQEDDVMEMVQSLREKAYAEGNLKTNKQQKVIVEKETIIIEPAYSHMIYVPYYDPYYVYGSWWYPSYRPYYWGPSTVYQGFGVSFSSGIRLSFAIGSWSYFDWHRRVIYVNARKNPRFVRRDRVFSTHVWQHAPSHRRGVAYRDKRAAKTYRQAPHRSQRVLGENRGYSEDRSIILPSNHGVTNTNKTMGVKSRISPPEKNNHQGQREQTPRVIRKQLQTEQMRAPVKERQKKKWKEREEVLNPEVNDNTEQPSIQRGWANPHRRDEDQLKR
jgi:hypothetical protein